MPRQTDPARLQEPVLPRQQVRRGLVPLRRVLLQALVLRALVLLRRVLAPEALPRQLMLLGLVSPLGKPLWVLQALR